MIFDRRYRSSFYISISSCSIHKLSFWTLYYLVRYGLQECVFGVHAVVSINNGSNRHFIWRLLLISYHNSCSTILGQPFEEFSDSRVFGELAILHKAPRQATVKALTNGRVWVLDQHAYHQITVGYYIRTQDEIMGVLMKSQKLKVAGKAVLQMVANILKTEFFAGGEQIVCQGDPGRNIAKSLIFQS